MAVDRISSFAIADNNIVKLTEMGHVTELLYMSHRNSFQRILKLDKDHYVVLGPDGQPASDVKEFIHWESRAASANSLRKTFRRLRNIINANVIDVDFCRFVTLTYRQDDGPMRDSDRLYHDFDRYNKRFKRWCIKNGYDIPEYINTVEPQGSGAWHCHVLYFWPSKAPYLPPDVMADLWGQGFVTVRALRSQLGKSCDNVGAYLTAYLGDLDIESAVQASMDVTLYEVKEVQDEQEHKSKYYLKGARLYLYPPGMSIYRCSRGIKRPVETDMSYENAKRKVSGSALTFQSNLRIQLEGGVSNTISKRYYNSSVGSCQSVISGFRVDDSTGEILEDVEAGRYCPEMPVVDFHRFEELEGPDGDFPW